MSEEDLESNPDESRCGKRMTTNVDDYDSAFENDSDVERRRGKRVDLAVKEKTQVQLPSKSVFVEEYSREEGRSQRYHYLALDAYSRHKKLINDYLLYYPGARDALFKRDASKDKTDLDVIRENHKFLWSDDDVTDTWGKRMAKKYYDKLFREYCIADLSRYKENKIAMRWRTEKELIEGKGQFICGDKHCQIKDGLRSWEVNFAYIENGEKKNALVKLRLCSDCSYKLNYRHQKKEIKQKKKRKKSEQSESRQKVIKTENLSDDEQTTSKSDESASVAVDAETESELWKKPVQLDEKSRDEEFDDYFQDLFL